MTGFELKDRLHANGRNRSDRFHHRAGRHSVGRARGEIARLPP
jgi:hypothetical protein